jgi:enoyl-CoA hydratase/carnithine racemase
VTQPLLIEHHDGADCVTLNRPDSLNALNMAVDAGSIEAVIAMEDRNQVLCSRSEDFGEGIRAFLEKRKPVYIRR